MRKPFLKTLPTGLRVALAPCEAESVAVGVMVASGSRHESPALGGISHFIEHMVFKGTPTRGPLEITQAIEGRGGNFNAYTSEEATAFYAHLPSECLADAIDILSDMYLNASIPAGEFRREREVVIEEIRMYADEPDSVAQENLQRALFPRNAVGAPVAGTEETLRAMTPATLRKYIAGHYLAEKTVVAIAGAFDPDAALALVEKAFAPLAARKGAFDIERVDFSFPPVAETRVMKDINQAQLALGYRTFGVDDPRKYALTVLDGILGRSMSSRLFQEIREKRGLSYDISSRAQFFQDAGQFWIAAGLDPSKADATLATIDRELAKLKAREVPADELERAKTFLVGNFRLSHEKVLSKMLYHATCVLSFGRVMPTSEQVEGIARVTAADVRSLAREIFTNENRAVSWVVPGRG